MQLLLEVLLLEVLLLDELELDVDELLDEVLLVDELELEVDELLLEESLPPQPANTAHAVAASSHHQFACGRLDFIEVIITPSPSWFSNVGVIQQLQY